MPDSPFLPFKELTRIALGSGDCLSRPLTEQEWTEVFKQAVNQTVAAVLFSAADSLPEGQRPPKQLMKQWLFFTDKVETVSAHHEEALAKLTAEFERAGIRSCVLKGRGAASLYPVPARRANGDIDIWLEGGRKAAMGFLKGRYPYRNVVYHHVEVKMLPDIDVEVHFTPSWMFNPVLNSRLQRFFERNADGQFANMDSERGFCCPTDKFNAVYSIVHIYRHFFTEGVGVRHAMDYYMILRRLSDEDRSEVMSILRKLGMKSFTGAMMWVMGDFFGLDRNLMLCEPDASEGAFLLDEMMISGNFGHSDPRIKRGKGTSEGSVFLRKVSRQARFLTRYPRELLWSVPFKLWHFVWRKMHRHN